MKTPFFLLFVKCIIKTQFFILFRLLNFGVYLSKAIGEKLIKLGKLAGIFTISGDTLYFRSER